MYEKIVKHHHGDGDDILSYAAPDNGGSSTLYHIP